MNIFYTKYFTWQKIFATYVLPDVSAVGQVSPVSEAAGAGAVHLGVEDRVGAPLHLRSGMGQSVNNIFSISSNNIFSCGQHLISHPTICS